MTMETQLGYGTLHRLIPRPDLDIVFEEDIQTNSSGKSRASLTDWKKAK
nr:hypothetical protein [Paenibacillus mucilaginosus]